MPASGGSWYLAYLVDRGTLSRRGCGVYRESYGMNTSFVRYGYGGGHFGVVGVLGK